MKFINCWCCLQPDCDAHGDGADSDRAAERHTKAEHHGTTTHTRPAQQSVPPSRAAGRARGAS